MRKRTLNFKSFLLLVPILSLLAIPTQGLSTLIDFQDDVAYESQIFLGVTLALVDVKVYNDVGPSPLDGVTIGAGEKLYTYEVYNPGDLPLSLTSYIVFRDPGAPISAMGSTSGEAVTSVSDGTLIFTALSIYAGETDILWMTSPGDAISVTSSFGSSFGPSFAPLVLAPDPIFPQEIDELPEPATLLLLGGGLIGLAGLRKFLAKRVKA